MHETLEATLLSLDHDCLEAEYLGYHASSAQNFSAHQVYHRCPFWNKILKNE